MKNMINGFCVIRSDRKTVSVEIKPDLSVTVRAPRRMRENEIAAFLNEKQGWIEKNLKKMKMRRDEMKNAERKSISHEEIEALAKRALEVVPQRVGYFAQKIGVNFGKITIRNQTTRWGSCSSKGNLNFNCLLILCPDDVVDYVVIHELCHLKHMNHSPLFWREVEKYCPNYREKKLWLKQNGTSLIEAMKNA